MAGDLLGYASPEGPGGGAGGPGRILTGINFAVYGSKTLLGHTPLFWFPFFTGLVPAGLFAAHYLIRTLSVYPYDAVDLPRQLVLAFVTELAAVFCLSVLLAALSFSLHGQEGRILPFRGGFARALEFLPSLAAWSGVMALAGMLIYPLALLLRTTHSLVLSNLFNQFPFGFIILPENYHIGPMGGTYAILAGLENTLIFSAINLLLFVLTLFVIPHLVIGKKNLRDAVRGSGALLKNVWPETVSCFLALGCIAGAAALTSLLFPFTYGILAPGMQFQYYPGDLWIAAALVYAAAFICLASSVITAGGIAVLELYDHAKAGPGAR